MYTYFVYSILHMISSILSSFTLSMTIVDDSYELGQDMNIRKIPWVFLPLPPDEMLLYTYTYWLMHNMKRLTIIIIKWFFDFQLAQTARGPL